MFQPRAGGIDTLERFAVFHQFELEVPLGVLKLTDAGFEFGNSALQRHGFIAELPVFRQELLVESGGIGAVPGYVIESCAERCVLLCAGVGTKFQIFVFQRQFVDFLPGFPFTGGRVGLKKP